MPSGQSFKIAQVSAAHGLRGEVKLLCFLTTPKDIARYNPLHDSKGNAYRATVTGQIKELLIVQLDGIHDRTSAEKMRGLELFADATKLPAPEENQYYLHDLIGKTAMLDDGTRIGKVLAVHNFGAGDIVAIDHDGEELLLPFRDPFVREVRDDEIVITLPEYIEHKK